MKTATRGNVAEAAILSSLVKRGFDVLIPFGGGQPYDLVLDLRPQLLRVQCKTAWALGGCMAFNCQTTDHGRGRQSYEGLADILAVYFPPRQSVYFVPLTDIAKSKGWLRLEPPRNNQRKGVRFAADYELDRWSAEKFRLHVPPVA